jgi:hypothetical protein
MGADHALWRRGRAAGIEIGEGSAVLDRDLRNVGGLVGRERVKVEQRHVADPVGSGSA